MDRHQVVLADEQADLVVVAPAPHGVEDDEAVAVVQVDLRPLLLTDRVFQRQLVEAELAPQQLHVLVGRILDVEPEDLLAVLDQVADRLQRR